MCTTVCSVTYLMLSVSLIGPFLIVSSLFLSFIYYSLFCVPCPMLSVSLVCLFLIVSLGCFYHLFTTVCSVYRAQCCLSLWLVHYWLHLSVFCTVFFISFFFSFFVCIQCCLFFSVWPICDCLSDFSAVYLLQYVSIIRLLQW